MFSKLARLARNTKELLDFAEVFRSCDADMISLAESIDTSTPAGRLTYRGNIGGRSSRRSPTRITIGKEGVEISLLQVPFGNDGEMGTQPLRHVAFLVPGVRVFLHAAKPASTKRTPLQTLT